MAQIFVHLSPPLAWEALEGRSHDFPLIFCWQLILDILVYAQLSPPHLSLTTRSSHLLCHPPDLFLQKKITVKSSVHLFVYLSGPDHEEAPPVRTRPCVSCSGLHPQH